MKNKITVALVAISMLLLVAIPATAMEQTEYSDDQIQSFAAALTAIEQIQTAMQTQFNEIVEDSDMQTERFHELHSHYTQTQGSFPEGTSESDQAQFQSIFQELVQAEQATQQEMISAVEAEGLDVETFNAIVSVAQQNPELWEEIQDYRN